VGGFFLGEHADNFVANSIGNPILTRPFIDATNNVQTVELVAAPHVLAGTVTVSNQSQFWGAEVNLRRNLCCCGNFHFDYLVGFRTLGLNETLNITEGLIVLGPGGGSFTVNDRFSAQNRFYGSQVGGIAEWHWGDWSLNVTGKFAMGTTQQLVDIQGSTLTTDATGTTHSALGGLLAQSTNIGRHPHDQFTVIPELGVNLGYQVTDHIRAFVGYNFLYWSSVVRPGSQIDPFVNRNLIPPPLPGGPARPAFNLNSSDFWAQGINVGLLFQY
jgi:hypothetical protein